MNRTFYVSSRVKSIEIALRHEVDLVISLLEDQTLLPNCEFYEGIFERKFFKMIDTIVANREFAPTKNQIVEILHLVSETKPNAKILFHCEAGISRSTAMCMAALMQEHNDINRIEEMMKVIRPICAPNALILKYADEIFETDNRLQILGDKLADSIRLPFLKRF